MHVEWEHILILELEQREWAAIYDAWHALEQPRKYYAINVF